MGIKHLLGDLLQFGKGGPNLKANGGAVEARNPADTAMAIGRGATPIGADDWVTLGYNHTTSEINLYVDDLTGNDVNTGTPASPLKTITAARAKLRYFTDHVCRIFVADHTGAGYAWSVFGPQACTENIYVHGGWMLWNGATWIEDPTHTGKNVVVPPTAALAGSTSFEVVATGLTIDAYAGATIEILDGAGGGTCTGDRRTIRDNTTTTITPDEVFSGALNPGDHYRIFWPTVTINLGIERTISVSVGTPAPSSQAATGRVVGLALINLRTVNSDLTDLRSDGGSLILAGCYFDFSYYAVLNGGSTYYSGLDGFNEIPGYINMSCGLDFSAPSGLSWIGWGCAAKYGLQLQTPNGSFGYFVTPGKLHCEFGLTWLFGGRFLRAEVNNALADYGGPRCGLRVEGYFINFLIKSNASYGILAHDAAKIELLGVEMQNTSKGIVADGTGTIVRVWYTIGNASGIGMVTTNGATIRLATPPTLTGSAGDFSEDGGTTKRLNAALTNDTSFVDLATLSKIYRHDY